MAGSSSVTKETRVLKSARELAISAMLPVGAAPPSTAPFPISSESISSLEVLSCFAVTRVHKRNVLKRLETNEIFIWKKSFLEFYFGPERICDVYSC